MPKIWQVLRKAISTQGRRQTVSALMAFTLWVLPILPTVYGEDEECATIPENIRIWRDKVTIMGEEKDKDVKSYL